MLSVPDRIKELLHLDSCKKNIRIHFPNGERSDICNDLIVKNSVSFTESLCSQNSLKFGLCEASVFECETVGVGNIKGATIEVTCEVYCESSVTGAVWQMDLQAWVYAIPYGTFYVDSCQRQADMIHRKIVAYGGFANFSYKNAILEMKHNAYWSNQTQYIPDIFKTMMMISGSKEMLYDVEPTLLTLTEDSGRIASRQVYDDTYSLTVSYMGYAINSSNHTLLYYADYTEQTKTWSEILADLKYNQYTDALLDMVDVNSIFGCGCDNNNVALQRGKYLYPYQITQNYNAKANIFIPYKLNLYKRGVGQIEPSLLVSSEFRDKTKQKIYSVPLQDTPYPHSYHLYIDRNIESSPILGYYTFDESEIDYTKSFENVMDMSGLFAMVDRNNGIRFVNIQQQFGLLPSRYLYPNTNLYPEGVTGGKLMPEDYQSCWYEDEYTLPYGAVRCEYTDSNNVDKIYTLYLSGFDENTPTNTYKVYELDNDFIHSYKWQDALIQQACNRIATSISGVTYMPVDFVGRGLPYVEAGDTFEILTKSNDSITTIVLNHTITGEMTLTDSYKSV